MKKVYVVLLSVLMSVVFLSCDSSSSDESYKTPDATTKAKINLIASVINDMSGYIGKKGKGSDSGSFTVDGPDGGSATLTITYNETEDNAEVTMTMDFNNFKAHDSEHTVAIDGKITYYMETSSTESSYNFSVKVSGDVDVTIDNTKYAFSMKYKVEGDEDNVSVSGYVAINGEKYKIDETISEGSLDSSDEEEAK